MPKPPLRPTDEDKLRALGLPEDEYLKAKAELDKREQEANDPDVQRTWYDNSSAKEVMEQHQGPDILDKIIRSIKGAFGKPH